MLRECVSLLECDRATSYERNVPVARVSSPECDGGSPDGGISLVQSVFLEGDGASPEAAQS